MMYVFYGAHLNELIALNICDELSNELKEDPLFKNVKFIMLEKGYFPFNPYEVTKDKAKFIVRQNELNQYKLESLLEISQYKEDADLLIDVHQGFCEGGVDLFVPVCPDYLKNKIKIDVRKDEELELQIKEMGLADKYLGLEIATDICPYDLESQRMFIKNNKEKELLKKKFKNFLLNLLGLSAKSPSLEEF